MADIVRKFQFGGSITGIGTKGKGLDTSALPEDSLVVTISTASNPNVPIGRFFADGKVFSTGSVGYYVNGKVEVRE